MARLAYECNEQIRANLSDEATAMKPFACTSDKYCLYCCCNPQCCLLVQRKPPRHFWEAWYFWLGIALLLLFVVSSISSFIVAASNSTVKLMAGFHGGPAFEAFISSSSSSPSSSASARSSARVSPPRVRHSENSFFSPYRSCSFVYSGFADGA